MVPALTAIDLFSGCGGLSVGLEKAGFRVCAAVEIDAKAQATYQLNHTGVKLYGEDIRWLSAKAVLKDLGLKPGQLDLLAGCPPCQGFSRLRTRNKVTLVNDPRNDLISDFLRFVRVLKPKTVMLENVLALANDQRFERLCEELGRLRYKYIVHVLNAADYSVPQRRKRLILLASRVHTPAIAPRAAKRVTVREALKGIEAPSRTKDALHAVPEKRSEEVKALIRLIPRDGGSRSDLPTEYQLDATSTATASTTFMGAWHGTASLPPSRADASIPRRGGFSIPRRTGPSPCARLPFCRDSRDSTSLTCYTERRRLH